MASSVDQKTYLQKYLGVSTGDKKKKKKKAIKGKGFKIIDDDIDLTKLRPLEGDELDILDNGEDAPQIAGIIDERPEEVKKQEQFKTSSKWRVVNQDDGFNSKLQIEEIKKDIKETEKENEIIFGKMYSDSEDEKKNDSDLSPPKNTTDKQKNKPSKKHNSDSDFSPPRKKDKECSPKRRTDRKEDSDSPPRKHESRQKERVRKPSRWGEGDPREQSSDIRKERNHPKSKSPNPNLSPPRKTHKGKNYDSDISPPRKSKKDHSTRNRSPDSDMSPPRKRNKSPTQFKHNSRYDSRSQKSRKSRYSSDSDLSPPRKNHKRQKSISPTRKSQKQSSDKNQKRKYNSDSDISPPRREKDRYRSEKDNRSKRNNDSPPPSNKKMAKTLEGKKAGLQDARQLRQENQEFRQREEEVYKKMTDDVSGRNAQVVSRKGKRETSEERRNQREKAERQKELDEKYKKWTKGIKQIEAQEARLQDFMHEASKPLARHRDDRDLEDNLKQIERTGDPMLKYIRDKKRERGELPPERPSYKGNFPPNRFNIRPGYRWDGVDRSNGYEKKYFDTQSKRKAQEEEAYKWSTEDL